MNNLAHLSLANQRDTGLEVVHFLPPRFQPAIYCQPCGVWHEFDMVPDHLDNQGQQWLWNGDRVKPTFWPCWKGRIISANLGKSVICHFEVKDGNIIYRPDTDHSYAGQTHSLTRGPKRHEHHH